MRTFAKSQIRYSKSQRIGIFAFIILLIGIEAYDVFINKTYVENQLVEESFLTLKENEFKMTEFTIDLADEYVVDFAQSSQVSISPTIELIQEDETQIAKSYPRNFDPNFLFQEDWVNIGFTEEQAIAIIDCKNKLGGLFKTIDEIRKCLEISEDKFNEIQPFIQLESAPIIEATIDLVEETENSQIPNQATIELIEE